MIKIISNYDEFFPGDGTFSIEGYEYNKNGVRKNHIISSIKIMNSKTPSLNKLLELTRELYFKIYGVNND